MKRLALFAAALSAAGLALSGSVDPARPNPLALVAPAAAKSRIHFSFFFDSLQPYGHWARYSPYGFVFIPRVPLGWRPYTLGRWVYHAHYGWLWVSDEPFGWATYHYGWWDYDPHWGWFWVPGYDWAPSWVVWRIGIDFIGWAPIPARYVWGRRYHDIFDHWDDRYWRHANAWCFTRKRDFGARHAARVIFPAEHSATYVARSRAVHNARIVDSAIVNRGFDVAALEREAGIRVPRAEIRAVGVPPPRQTAGENSRAVLVNAYRPDPAASVTPSAIAAAPESQPVPREFAAMAPVLSPSEPGAAPPAHESVGRIAAPSRDGAPFARPRTGRPVQREPSEESAGTGVVEPETDTRPPAFVPRASTAPARAGERNRPSAFERGWSQGWPRPSEPEPQAPQSAGLSPEPFPADPSGGGLASRRTPPELGGEAPAVEGLPAEPARARRSGPLRGFGGAGESGFPPSFRPAEETPPAPSGLPPQDASLAPIAPEPSAGAEPDGAAGTRSRFGGPRINDRQWDSSFGRMNEARGPFAPPAGSGPGDIARPEGPAPSAGPFEGAPPAATSPYERWQQSGAWRPESADSGWASRARARGVSGAADSEAARPPAASEPRGNEGQAAMGAPPRAWTFERRGVGGGWGGAEGRGRSGEPSFQPDPGPSPEVGTERTVPRLSGRPAPEGGWREWGGQRNAQGFGGASPRGGGGGRGNGAPAPSGPAASPDSQSGQD